MHDDFIRQHIELAAGRDELRTRELCARLARGCWPGGADDRVEPGALEWVRRWRPATGAAVLPVCACSRGRCPLCN
jgi:hypothetical protein